MADHYLSVKKGTGLSPASVAAGTSSTAADHVEVRMLDGAGLNNLDVIMALDRIKAHIESNGYSVTA